MRPAGPRHISVIVLAALSSIGAHANPYSDTAGAFTASYSQTSATYSIAGVERDFTHHRYGIDYSEMGNDWFYGGIGVGLAFLDGASEPLISETSLPGYLFGLYGGVRYAMLDDSLALNLEARYLREWESGEISGSGGDQTTVRFGEGSVRLGASYRFAKVQLSAGGYSSNVVGHIERTGTVAGTADIEDTEQSGIYAGFEFKLDSGYAIGTRVESGAHDTLALTFSTSF